jgi:site-specific recombinase XerD
MSRPAHQERGLYSRPNKAGQLRWYVRIAVQGRAHRFAPHGGFPRRAEALTFLNEARARLRLGQFFPEQFQAIALPLSDLLQREDLRANSTHPNAKNDETYLEWWQTFAGHHDAKQLPVSLIESARRTLEQKKLQPQTVHHYLKFLRHILNVAKREGLIEHSPFDRTTLKPVHNLRERFYARTERRRLLKALGPVWREAAEFAWITGLRWAEQFGLERERIRLREGYVTLNMTKAGRPQVRLLNARARALCRAQLRRAGGSRWLYPNQAGTGPVDYANFRKRIWLPACLAAGVTNARWNDWRHTFASDLTMAGHSDRTVATLLGHTSTQMVARYAHLAPSHLRRAVEDVTMANQPPTKKAVRRQRTA